MVDGPLPKGSASTCERGAIDKAFSLLAAFGREANAGVGVSELARRAELSKSTAFRVLAVLERNGVVCRQGLQYRIGSQLYELGYQALVGEYQWLQNALTPYLAQLFELTHETVHLAVLRGPDVVYLNKLYGHRHFPAPSRIGGVVPAYCTAIGKAMLAHDPQGIEETLARGLVRWTSKTLASSDDLERALEFARLEGMAVDDEESRQGLHCLAVPVFNAQRSVVAAFSVAGAAGKIDPGVHGRALRRVGYEASRALATRRTEPRPLDAV
ncbi:IclR family transcriptional regulator [Nocardioides jensenii]|uniref:IclR family transcriptional regulator n=1 Tax=Nocardioides jensenii TaxID=1843 RepID=UPI0008329791|nr:IclR family transcriptional regulator [Nocardioides jensenii]